jgi:hypothetical protein
MSTPGVEPQQARARLISNASWSRRPRHRGRDAPADVTSMTGCRLRGSCHQAGGNVPVNGKFGCQMASRRSLRPLRRIWLLLFVPHDWDDLYRRVVRFLSGLAAVGYGSLILTGGATDRIDGAGPIGILVITIGAILMMWSALADLPPAARRAGCSTFPLDLLGFGMFFFVASVLTRLLRLFGVAGRRTTMAPGNQHRPRRRNRADVTMGPLPCWRPRNATRRPRPHRAAPPACPLHACRCLTCALHARPARPSGRRC